MGHFVSKIIIFVGEFQLNRFIWGCTHRIAFGSVPATHVSKSFRLTLKFRYLPREHFFCLQRIRIADTGIDFTNSKYGPLQVAFM